jgi:hypothetical protein
MTSDEQPKREQSGEDEPEQTVLEVLDELGNVIETITIAKPVVIIGHNSPGGDA